MLAFLSEAGHHASDTNPRFRSEELQLANVRDSGALVATETDLACRCPHALVLTRSEADESANRVLSEYGSNVTKVEIFHGPAIVPRDEE